MSTATGEEIRSPMSKTSSVGTITRCDEKTISRAINAGTNTIEAISPIQSGRVC